jgi:hypothetical protein
MTGPDNELEHGCGCKAQGDLRLAAAVAIASVAVGAAILLGAVAVVLARNGGKWPAYSGPRLMVALHRAMPDDPGGLVGAGLP